MFPKILSLYSIVGLVCDNVHFIGANAREFIMLCWQEYTVWQQAKLGMFNVVFPPGFPNAPTDASSAAEYAAAVTAPAIRTSAANPRACQERARPALRPMLRASRVRIASNF